MQNAIIHVPHAINFLIIVRVALRTRIEIQVRLVTTARVRMDSMILELLFVSSVTTSALHATMESPV